MDVDRFVSGEKARAVWREMEELKEEAKHAYCERRRLEVPEDIQLGHLRSEWFSVGAAFAAWCQKAHMEGRLADNPQNVISYHFLIGSTPLWDRQMRPDMDGGFSVMKWLRQVIETPNHFMPPNAFSLFGALDAYERRRENEKIDRILEEWRAEDAAKAALEAPKEQREDVISVTERGDTLIIRHGPYFKPDRPGVLSTVKKLFRRVTGNNTSEM